MERVSIEDLRKKVSNGHERIRWAGSTASGKFAVLTVLSDGSTAKYTSEPETWCSGAHSAHLLRFREASPGYRTCASISPPDETVFSSSRRAAVLGVNIGGDCTVGACKQYSSIGMCTLSYDIETSMEGVPEGGFGLVDSEILSIASSCSCGHEFYVSFNSGNSSQAMVSMFVEDLVSHSPLWTIGWNNYTFDNECMRYHAHKSIKGLFLVCRIGTYKKPSYGSIINIPGTYNVDVLVYMVRSLYKLHSFKLADVAETMKVTRKMTMPVMNSYAEDEDLRKYNMNDCIVVLEIWKKENFEYVIPSIAVCTASPVYDCSRYVTGTLASLGYSSYVLSQGKLIVWSSCDTEQEYEGGYVMVPTKGLHENILVCDFSSMYPTIIASCNINPHSFAVDDGDSSLTSGGVRTTETTTTVNIGGKFVTFDSTEPSIMSSFMRYMVTERGKVKKTNPMYALSLKVLANSVYGAMGYKQSHIYSPSCAASVTAIGRHCIKMAASFFRAEGLTVLYGDTDSCMVTGTGSRDDVERSASRALNKLHSRNGMGGCSLRLMRMEVEEYYRKGIMMGKKRYCMLREDGSYKTVGVSLARKDVSPVCKMAAETCIKAIFADDPQERIDRISKFVSAIAQMAAAREFTLGDVSKYVKKDDKNGYEYQRARVGAEFVPEDEADLSSKVDYDTAAVLEAVSAEIDRFTIPCNMGSVSAVVNGASMSTWF